MAAVFLRSLRRTIRDDPGKPHHVTIPVACPADPNADGLGAGHRLVIPYGPLNPKSSAAVRLQAMRRAAFSQVRMIKGQQTQPFQGANVPIAGGRFFEC